MITKRATQRSTLTLTRQFFSNSRKSRVNCSRGESASRSKIRNGCSKWPQIAHVWRRKMQPVAWQARWKNTPAMNVLSETSAACADPAGEELRRCDALPELSRFLTQERHPVHLVGVAGSGMSGLAGLLIELGHAVSGSDKATTTETDRLQRLGLRFYDQHLPDLANRAELVVFSSAIKDDNPILRGARNSGKSLVRRAEALAAIMHAKRGIVIAGMHGKTTTSAMTAHVLREGGLHPSHYVGAEIPILGTNAYWNERGEYFVAEGDESDGTLRCFHPEHALILNIEEEHLDFYPDRQDHGIASEIRARAPPVRDQIRERQVSARRRLCASSDGNSCHTSRSEIDRPATSRYDVSAAPFFTNKSAVPRIWQRLRRCGPDYDHGCVSCQRATDSRNHRSDYRR